PLADYDKPNFLIFGITASPFDGYRDSVRALQINKNISIWEILLRPILPRSTSGFIICAQLRDSHCKTRTVKTSLRINKPQAAKNMPDSSCTRQACFIIYVYD